MLLIYISFDVRFARFYQFSYVFFYKKTMFFLEYYA